MRSRSPLPALLLTAAGVCVLAPPAFAQQDLETQLEALRAREGELEQKMRTLQTEFANADAERRTAIEAEAETVGQTFQTEILRQRNALLTAAKAAPTLSEKVGTWAASTAFFENDFPASEALARKLLAAAPDNGAGLNLLAQSLYNQDKFDEAEQVFAKAKAAGKLAPDFAPFADIVGQAKTYWAEEQATRQKQAGMNLPQVRFKTNKGDILIELYEEEAPNTVKNFVKLTEQGYYDNLAFHRVIENFMAQVGDPRFKADGSGQGGPDGPGYNIPSEYGRPGMRRHFAGTLSMANTGPPNTGGGQIFLTHRPTFRLDGDAGTSRHTVFGRVVEGLDVLRSVRQGDVVEDAEVVRKRPGTTYEPETLPAT